MNDVLSSSLGESVLRKRKRLLHAIKVLEANSEKSVTNRLALAEAEFRVAILPGTDLQEAIERIQKSVKHDPYHPKYFFHLGRFFYCNGDYRSAISEFRHTLKLAAGSHRAYVHLALALIELEESEKNLGRDMLDALSRGAQNELSQYLIELDDLIKKQSEGKKTQKSLRQKAKKPKDTGHQETPVPCRWIGIWRVILMEQLTRLRPVLKQIEMQLNKGSSNLNGETSITEYAMACLLLLLGGDSPQVSRKWLNDQKLDGDSKHCGVRLADTTITLAESKEPDQFIEKAVTLLQTDSLPLEIICWLHYLKYGPGTSLPITEALNHLNAYPSAIQEGACFKELRVAILDGYARKAWAEGRFDYARLFWREIISFDPNRIAAYHNLALVATRTKSYADYTAMWGRATELRYLYAAVVGDVQMMLEDRRTLHLSFAQQSRNRYCGSSKTPEQLPEKKELAAWISDRETLEVWLNEWDLYYLNSRLWFRSPMHLLGIARDASPEMADSAQKTLLHQLDISLRNQSWAGIKTFCALAEQRIAKAFESVSDLVARARDLYYEQEQSDADNLAREAIDRGFLLHRMMMLLAENAVAQNIKTGCAIARHLFLLPWDILQPICISQGKIEKDTDLVKVFESYFLAIAAADQSKPKTEKETVARLSDLEECIAILPHRIELRIIRCQFLLLTDKNADAYHSAIDAFSRISETEDKNDVKTLEHNLMVLIDEAAFAELPEHLKEPGSLEQAKETVRQGRVVLEKFPQAGAFRGFLADLMIQLCDEIMIKDAVDLLKEGLKIAMTAEQSERFKTLLQKADVQSEVVAEMEKIITSLKDANERVNEAVDEFEQNLSDKSFQRGREVVAAAIKDAEKAKQMAQNARLKDLENRAEALLTHFKKLQETFQKDEGE